MNSPNHVKKVKKMVYFSGSLVDVELQVIFFCNKKSNPSLRSLFVTLEKGNNNNHLLMVIKRGDELR